VCFACKELKFEILLNVTIHRVTGLIRGLNRYEARNF